VACLTNHKASLAFEDFLYYAIIANAFNNNTFEFTLKGLLAMDYQEIYDFLVKQIFNSFGTFVLSVV
jgi:hypothetical protein